MTMYPNSRVAPHQERAGAIRTGVARIESAALGASFEPNRAQRRDYVRHNQTRQVRKNLIGFGRWRRHNESDEPSYASQTAVAVQLAPRWERRPHMIREAKLARWIRRRSYEKRTLGGQVRSAVSRLTGGKLA